MHGLALAEHIPKATYLLNMQANILLLGNIGVTKWHQLHGQLPTAFSNPALAQQRRLDMHGKRQY